MYKRMNPRDMRRAMSRMGVTVDELSNAEKVEITLPDKVLEIRSPAITVMKMEGQTIYQIVGEPVEKPKGSAVEAEPLDEVQIPDEDVQLVAAQAGVSLDAARKALQATRGDLAQAILFLKG